MAKALLGHVGIGTDPRLVAEVRRLRIRVRDLEDEVARVHAANDMLSAPVVVVDRNERDFEHASDEDYQSVLREPALA
ncbi:MAG TPA: hypothetical protein VGN54_00510 [Mycobacteriales bacterium]|jgi:hypothetical protein|nr:hypothetical protein [Mycobacteriales bacterium]